MIGWEVRGCWWKNGLCWGVEEIKREKRRGAIVRVEKKVGVSIWGGKSDRLVRMYVAGRIGFVRKTE